MGMLGIVSKKLAEGAQTRLKAYHGSPHDMPAVDMVVHKETGKSYYIETDRFGSYKNHPVIKKSLDQYEFVDHFPQGHFDSSKIGTGEGAQAYGHGLYFAEREGTAMSYRDALTPRDFDYEEYLMEQYKAAESMEDYNRMDMLERAMQHDTPADFRDIASDADYDDDYRQLAADMADEMEGFVNPNGNPVNFGRMYEVDIDASPDELLDYDLPLNTQSPKIQKSIDDLMKSRGVESYVRDGGDGAETIYIGTGLGGLNTGSEILKTLSGERGPSGASKILKDVGIKGIKYADAQTRFSPKGKTSNYVMFDDKLVEIARKYGVTMPVAGAILAGTITPEQAQAGAAETDTGEKNYDAIYAERDARKTMSPRERKHAPLASKALRDHTLSTILPSLGNAVQGFVRGGAETLDYLHPANLARLQYDPANEGLSRFTSPSIVNSVSNLVDPVVKPVLYDEDDPEGVERAEKAKAFGELFSY